MSESSPSGIPDDLLQPSLTADHDLEGIDRPWNPMVLMVLSFFAGYVGTFFLVDDNNRRLGLPRRPGVSMLLLVAYALVYFVVVHESLVYEKFARQRDRLLQVVGQVLDEEQSQETGLELASDEMQATMIEALKEDGYRGATYERPLAALGLNDRRSLRRTRNTFFHALSVLIVFLISGKQRQRYRLVSAYGLEEGKLLLRGIGAFALGFVIHFTIAFLATRWVG